MSRFYPPGYYLKEAEKLCDKGLKQQALNQLVHGLTNRKYPTWQQIHKPIIEKYLELCVELRNVNLAKDGLTKYKSFCPPAQIQSLDGIVRRFLGLAWTKTKTAGRECNQEMSKIADLEQVQFLENLMLDSELAKKFRPNINDLTLWVNFLWQSYKHCLLLLLDDAHFEELYHEIAWKAFQICLANDRKVEFRRLCKMLKVHSTYVLQHQNTHMAVNLNNLLIQQLRLATSYRKYIATKSKMNLEAENAIDEIHLKNVAGLPKAYLESDTCEELVRSDTSDLQQTKQK